jgi:hypothetical protein
VSGWVRGGDGGYTKWGRSLKLPPMELAKLIKDEAEGGESGSSLREGQPCESRWMRW